MNGTKLLTYPQVLRRSGRDGEQKQQHTEARSCALQHNHTHEIGEVVSRWLFSILVQIFPWRKNPRTPGTQRLRRSLVTQSLIHERTRQQWIEEEDDTALRRMIVDRMRQK